MSFVRLGTMREQEENSRDESPQAVVGKTADEEAGRQRGTGGLREIVVPDPM